MENKEIDNSDPDWILDSLVTYLRSPVWNIPIQNFMEQKSVIFDRDAENDAEYHQVHDEFRNLVDLMLGAYMDDLSLQPEILEKALLQIHPSVRSAALQELLEPVKAAGEFEAFKQLMHLKNEQLHRQALEIIQQQRDLELSGIFEGIPSVEADKIPGVIDENFEQEIREALRLSLLEQDKQKHSAVLEKRDLERALAASVAETFTKDQVEEKPAEPLPQTVQEEQQHQQATSGDVTDVESRRALLRVQRDRLLALKHQQREKQLKQLEDLQASPGNRQNQLRPKSGSMARAALTGKTNEASVDEKTIQYRRLLLQKIRDEVEGDPK